MAWWIFQHVVTTALLALIVALVCRFTRIGPVARHALWVLVLIKFVTPPLVAGPWTMPDPLGLSAIDSTHSAALIEVEPMSPAEEFAVEIDHAPIDAAPLTPDAPVWPWLVGLWVTGSLLLASVEGIRLVRLARRTRAASPAPAALRDRVAAHASRMGLAAVPIVLVDGARAPSVWGLIRPRILWPASMGVVTETGTDGLIVHELAHVKRRDHLVGWIELAGGVLWWWNPLFWSVRSALREQAELACDAWVISALPDGRRAYAEVLLAFCSEGSRSVPSMAVVGISATTRRALERRLVMIMKGRTSLRLTSVGLCSLAVAAAAALPTWAASPQVVQPPSVVPPAMPTAAASPASSAPSAVAAPQWRPGPSTPPPTLIQSTAQRPSVAQRPTTRPPRAVAPQIVGGRGRLTTATLPEAARALADAFEKDQQSYLEEMTRKISARRETFNAEMQRLQDDLTKAGNLDDAVAVRDYLRRGSPTAGFRPATGRGGRGAVAAPVAARGRMGGGGR